MRLLPMNVPAELHRRIDGDDAGLPSDVLVAKGPLVIMAHGLMAFAPDDRESCWITSPLGDLTPTEAADALRNWSRRPNEGGVLQ
jgi:hypothetical protein